MKKFSFLVFTVVAMFVASCSNQESVENIEVVIDTTAVADTIAPVAIDTTAVVDTTVVK